MRIEGIEIVKDLTPELNKKEAKDEFYQIHAEVPFLLAVQDPETVRPYVYKRTGWGSIERVEARTDGTPTTLTAPKKKTKRRTGEEEIKSGRCFSFRTVGTDVLIPWGGPFGVLKQGLRRSLEAKGKLRYDNARLDLIKVYPVNVRVSAPIDSQKPTKNPKVVLTTRHTQSGDVMVDEFFDYLENRKFDFYIEVDSGCPVNEEKLTEMFGSLNTLDNFGASKRGQVKITGIERVNISGDALRKLEKA
jgi:hypothetical protein